MYTRVGKDKGCSLDGWHSSQLPREKLEGGKMKVGDLVRWKGDKKRSWYGIITKRSSPYSLHVVWPSGAQGWFMVGDLEVV